MNGSTTITLVASARRITLKLANQKIGDQLHISHGISHTIQYSRAEPHVTSPHRPSLPPGLYPTVPSRGLQLVSLACEERAPSPAHQHILGSARPPQRACLAHAPTAGLPYQYQYQYQVPSTIILASLTSPHSTHLAPLPFSRYHSRRTTTRAPSPPVAQPAVTPVCLP